MVKVHPVVNDRDDVESTGEPVLPGPPITPETLRLLLRGIFGYLAHEIAGAVNLIVGWSSMLEQADVPEPQRKHLKTIGHAAQTLVQHTRDTVDRIAVQTECRCNIAETTQNVARRLQDLGAPLALSWQGSGDLEISMCPDVASFLLWQTLLPLATELPPGGQVIATALRDEVGRGAPARWIITPPAKTVRCVSLPPLDPFRDGKTARDMGYFVVNRILREHSGRLSVESMPDGYLERLTLYVPLAR